MSRFTSDWLNHSLLTMPGFFFEGDDSPGGDPPPDPPADPAGDPKPEPKTYDEATVKALRDENAKARRRLKELEDAQKKADDAKLSETERLKKEADEAKTRADATEQKARARVAKAEVLTAATRAGAADADVVFALIKDSVEFDDDGEPTNVTALVEKLLTDKPFLKQGDGKSGGGQNTSNTNGATGRGGKWTSEAAEKLAETNPKEFNRLFEAGAFKGVL